MVTPPAATQDCALQVWYKHHAYNRNTAACTAMSNTTGSSATYLEPITSCTACASHARVPAVSVNAACRHRQYQIVTDTCAAESSDQKRKLGQRSIFSCVTWQRLLEALG